MNRRILSWGLFYFSLSTAALGAPIFGVQPVSYSGSGCPSGSLSSVVSPDGSTLTLLFDGFEVASAAGNGGSQIAYKDCVLRIPVDLPVSTTFRRLDTDFRGYVALPLGGKTRLLAVPKLYPSTPESPVRWGRGTLDIRGEKSGPFLMTLGATGIYSGCWGKKLEYVEIRVMLQTQSNTRGDSSLATIDTADAGGPSLTMRASLAPCEKRN